MGLFDVTGFGEKTEDSNIPKSHNTFQDNSFDRSITQKINPLLKMDVINSHYNMGKILEDYGVDISGSNCYCPFHDDELTGKPSAKYHFDTDKLFCFSENKMYSAYHAIKLLYGIDIDKVFMSIWSKMSLEERHELMDKYEESEEIEIKNPSLWDRLRKQVLDKFKNGDVNFHQYKNALYKVLKMVNEDIKKGD